ncbi:MAG: ABC transporter ATP-binding protein [Zoogloeaceae bacterium]|jgi:NitT/TauT family transport system ATP-binding protein|nr:ABC transporter ATP-binding protein [Zoogloeaceae bacterium]
MSAITPSPVLELDALRKAFPAPGGGAPVSALSGVSLRVFAGEYVSLLGESGCGKSTLLALIAGLLPPDGGRVICEGREVSGPDRHRMLMFQADALFPWLDVLGNVVYSLKFSSGLSRKEREERALEFLTLVGLADFRRARAHELSGGMRQRAALARALAADPRILLMDEPFSALDAMTRERLYADVQRIWRETGKTIIMVTHNVREAVCLSTRVVLMKPPGALTGEETVDLPYPRQMNDVALAVLAGKIHDRLRFSAKEAEA